VTLPACLPQASHDSAVALCARQGAAQQAVSAFGDADPYAAAVRAAPCVLAALPICAQGALPAGYQAISTPPPGYTAPLPPSTGPAPTPESKVGLYLGIGAALLVLGAGAYLVFRD